MIPRRLLLILIILTIGGIYVLLVLPPLQSSSGFEALPPPLQYVAYNFGFYLLFSGVIGTLVSQAVYHRITTVGVLISGLGTFVLFSFVYDMLQPPFALSPSGQFIISQNGTLAGTAVDYMTAWSWSQVGISGPALYYMTYAVTPILAIIVSVLVLGAGRFLKVYGAGL